MPLLKGLNLTVLFLIELAALAAVAYWGATLAAPAWVRVLAAVAAPAVLVAAWALFGARNARRKFHGVARVVFETVWFGAAIVALGYAGRVVLAIVLAAVCLVSKLLAWRWRQ